MGRSQPPGRHRPAGRTRILRGPGCAARGRRFAERILAGTVDAETIERVNLVISELVTNAYQHGRGAIELELGLRRGHVRVEVDDEGRRDRPHIRDDAGEQGGWGLMVVDMLASAWGVQDGRAHVWADVAVAPA